LPPASNFHGKNGLPLHDERQRPVDAVADDAEDF
jgi:hypothetical protein